MNSVDEKKCCGCNSCVLICPKSAIKVVYDRKGFSKIKVDGQKCVECGLCTKVCPMINIHKNPEDDLQKYYAYRLLNLEDRLKSQSGGAFSGIAQSALNNKWLLYGVAAVEDEIRYVRVTNISELDRLRGSKYVQAKLYGIHNMIKKDLEEGERVLICGTPCCLSGIKNYLNETGTDTNGLFTIDLICHGTPSPRILHDYFDYLENKYGQIIHFNYRDKIVGWNGHICSFETIQGRYYSKDYADLFYSNATLNECCHKCDYSSFSRIGDLTIGDFWGCSDYYPELDDKMGTSLVIVNNHKGLELKQIDIMGEYVEIKKEYCYQRNLHEPTPVNSMTDLFWKTYEEYGLSRTSESLLDIKLGEYTEDSYFWCDYDIESLYYNLYEKKIVLYGIGLPMLQLVRMMDRRGYHFSAISDRRNDYDGQFFFDIPIIPIGKINWDSNTFLLICSKNDDNISAIFNRITEKDKVEASRVITLNSFKSIRDK